VDSGSGFVNIPGATSTTLSFATAPADNGKQYRAVFTDACGSVNTSAALLTAQSSPAITLPPASNAFCSGSAATFTATASRFPVPTVQWHLSTDGGSTFNDIPGETNTTLSFPAAPPQNNNQYRAVFTNTCGVATSNAAILTVNIGPAVTTDPITQTVPSN